MKKCKIILFIILLTSILLAVSIIRKPEYPYNTTIEEYDGVIGLIDSETKIEQSFVSKIDSLDSIEVVFANYDNKITKGHLIAKIYNSDHQMIYLNRFNLSSLEDNKPIRVSFDIQKNCKGKRFYLEIDARDLAKDEYVTLYSANEKDYILEDSETIIKPIAIEQYGAKKGYYYTIVLTIILFIETLILFLVYYKINKKYICYYHFITICLKLTCIKNEYLLFKQTTNIKLHHNVDNRYTDIKKYSNNIL